MTRLVSWAHGHTQGSARAEALGEQLVPVTSVGHGGTPPNQRCAQCSIAGLVRSLNLMSSYLAIKHRPIGPSTSSDPGFMGERYWLRPETSAVRVSMATLRSGDFFDFERYPTITFRARP